MIHLSSIFYIIPGGKKSSGKILIWRVLLDLKMGIQSLVMTQFSDKIVRKIIKSSQRPAKIDSSGKKVSQSNLITNLTEKYTSNVLTFF